MRSEKLYTMIDIPMKYYVRLKPRNYVSSSEAVILL
jgi:hypothetical protein